MEEQTQMQMQAQTAQTAQPQTTPQQKKRKEKIIIATGTRKRSVARAIARSGSGRVRINSRPLGAFPRYVKMRVQEPLMLAGDAARGVDIDVRVKGGGTWGQADATRTAIANALVKFIGGDDLRFTYLSYDRTLLIADARRTEPHKPSRSTAGPRRTKQQSKR